MKKSMLVLAALTTMVSGIYQEGRADPLNGVLLKGSMYFDGGHMMSGDQSVVVMSLGSDPESPCEFHFPGDNKSYWTLSKYIVAPTPKPEASPSASPTPIPEAVVTPTPQPAQEQHNDQIIVGQPTPPQKRRHQEGEPDESGKIWHRDAEGHLKWQPANKVRQEEKASDTEPSATPE
jgi:hypothetical protein